MVKIRLGEVVREVLPHMLTNQVPLLAMPVQNGINRNRREGGERFGGRKLLLLLLLLLLGGEEDEIVLVNPIGMARFETLSGAHTTHSTREGITFSRFDNMLE